MKGEKTTDKIYPIFIFARRHPPKAAKTLYHKETKIKKEISPRAEASLLLFVVEPTSNDCLLQNAVPGCFYGTTYGSLLIVCSVRFIVTLGGIHLHQRNDIHRAHNNKSCMVRVIISWQRREVDCYGCNGTSARNFLSIYCKRIMLRELVVG